MKLYCVACEVFARECARAVASSPHVVDLSLQAFGLHNRPDDLRNTLQAEIDKASDGKYDYVLLGYGLCSRGTAEIVARDTPLVIPRAHDCITLLLGSKERYEREFAEHPGPYYYSPGWIERKEGDVSQGTIEIVQERQAKERFLEYVERYGEDNAQYLLDQEQLWQSHYDRAAFLNTGLGDLGYYRTFTRQVAETSGWRFEEVAGDTWLIDRLFRGEWNSNKFLIVKFGQRTVEDVNQGIIAAV